MLFVFILLNVQDTQMNVKMIAGKYHIPCVIICIPLSQLELTALYSYWWRTMAC